MGWRICSWLPFAQILVSKGYNVVLLEQRGTGASAKVTDEQLKHLDRDFLAASQELTRRGATAIIAGGASQGGTAAINTAPKIPSLAGLIVFSSPRDSDMFTPVMDALESVKKVTKPSFFAVSPGDMGNAFVVEVKGLYEASGATEKHYETVGGGIHGVAMMDSPEGGAALREKLLAFIADAFAKAGLSDSADTSTAGAPAGTGAEPATAAGTGDEVAAGDPVTASDERPWTPIALAVGVVAALLIGAVGWLRRRRT
jgi:pimeloyl-ACP methyl ester carboxylesterase